MSKQVKSYGMVTAVEDAGAERFGSEHMEPFDAIALDEARFQNRMGKFGEATVRAIVERGTYDQSRDPLIVWRDPKDGKLYLLAGYSRREAFRQLRERGEPVGTGIRVKRFRGTEKEAMDFALLESNRGGQAEGLRSDIRAYKRAVAAGKSSAELLALFKKESAVQRLRDLSHLAERSRFLEAMESDAAGSFAYLERNATWVGQLRATYPQLTDAHEGELFDFIYRDGGMKLAKDKLFQRIEGKVSRIDFDPAQPLNMAGGVSTSAYTEPAREEIARLEKEVDKLRAEIERKQAGVVEAMGSGRADDARLLRKAIDEKQATVLRLLQELQQWKQRVSKAERELPDDLFSVEIEEVKAMEPEAIAAKEEREGKRRLSASQRKRLRATMRGMADATVENLRTITHSDQAERTAILRTARMIHAMRSLYSQFVDEASTNKRRLAPTRDNLIAWAAQPGRYDLIGIDNADANTVTTKARKRK